jgi:hypothetical protein
MSSTIKRAIVTAAFWGLLPAGVAYWLLQKLRLTDE